MEALNNVGISADNIAHLGRRLTAESKHPDPSTGVDDEDSSQAPEPTTQRLRGKLRDAVPDGYARSTISTSSLLDHLEFEEPAYFEALRTPATLCAEDEDVDEEYLFQRWSDGDDAGVLEDDPHVLSFPAVWRMSTSERQGLITQWTRAVLQDEAEHIATLIHAHNREQDGKALNPQGVSQILQGKRIIVCTATTAAEYRADIRVARPGILLVEEAGQILESHVIAAMGPSVRQLILIGDHQQLRPKCHSYDLTVEAGGGYDLNRSLFERLVLQGYPHQILNVQHRMQPEIADLVRQLAYPHLADDSEIPPPSSQALQRSVVFVDHSHDEDVLDANLRLAIGDGDRSRTNEHEADMILNIVKYLSQRGHSTRELTVLTPCLGQLSLLHGKLSRTLEPVLNDLDSHELDRAGLLPAVSLVASKPSTLR